MAGMIGGTSSRRVRRGLIFASAVALIAGVAGCGGDSSEASPPAVGSAFADRALAVCRTALEQKRAWQPFPVADFDPRHPDAAKLAGVAVWLDGQVTPTFEGWRDGLQALGEPPSGRAAWDETVADVVRVAQLNAAQIDAARRGDAEAFAQATEELRALQPGLQEAAEAAGVPRCADVHGK